MSETLGDLVMVNGLTAREYWAKLAQYYLNKISVRYF